MALAMHGAAATRATSSLTRRDRMRADSSSSSCCGTNYSRISTLAPRPYGRLRPHMSDVTMHHRLVSQRDFKGIYLSRAFGIRLHLAVVGVIDRCQFVP